MGLVLGCEHAGKRGWFEHRAVLVGATSQQRRKVSGHVFGRGVAVGGPAGTPWRSATALTPRTDGFPILQPGAQAGSGAEVLGFAK